MLPQSFNTTTSTRIDQTYSKINLLLPNFVKKWNTRRDNFLQQNLKHLFEESYF